MLERLRDIDAKYSELERKMAEPEYYSDAEAYAKLAKEQGLDNGYRVISNVGEDAGQTVKHLHLHVLGGKKMDGRMA